MAWEAWLTISVILLCFGLMASNRVPADICLMGGVTILLVSGVLTPGQALEGLSNQGMVTVGVLYVVVSGMKETGGVSWLAQSLMGKPKSVAAAQLRLMSPTAVLSAFLNNTPVVAMLVPATNEWAKQQKLSVSKLMMPLSYAAIAGGACTLIGTSTNLVVNGLLIDQTEHAGLSMFDIAWVALPCAILVFIYVLVTSQWLLPERKPVISRFSNVREFTTEMVVESGGPLAGKTIEEAGLRQLPGLYLIEINRAGQVIPAVSSQQKLHANDQLIFAGIIDSVVDLQKIHGLKIATNQVFKLQTPLENRSFIEAVVSNSCPLAGKSIRQGRFRTVYNAAVIAVARNGVRINKKIGDIVLRPGDTLLLEADPEFVEQQRNSRDFFLVSRLGDAGPPRHNKFMLASVIVLAMVVVVSGGWLSMLEGALLAAGLMIVTRCTTGRVARRAVDWPVLIVIGASFGIGNALYATGAAQAIASNLIAVAGDTPEMSLATVFVMTAVFTALVTNNAAAVLMFPVAIAVAEHLGVSFMPFIITIMMAASASFATPIGYQTNLMVFGPGGYRFHDFLRFGLPLTVLIGFATVLIVPLVWAF